MIPPAAGPARRHVLSVYKPCGLTPYGWRWEDEQRRTQLERRAKPAA